MQDFVALDGLLPRYLRRSLKVPEKSSRNESLRKVEWFPGFYALPGNLPLSTLTHNEEGDYKDQGYFPMDIASALAVVALGVDGVSGPLSVLDLCCCPGNKMQLISEMIDPSSRIVGVDISQNRLFVCKSLLEQWQGKHLSEQSVIPRLLVFNQDGRTFGADSAGTLVFDSSYLGGELASGRGHNALRNKSARARERKALAEAAQQLQGLDLFNRVLVDAECTHDASYRHMKFSGGTSKWSRRSSEDVSPAPTLTEEAFTLSHQITDVHHLDESKQDLIQLQRDLLLNGFRRLAIGGILVYSTCSHDEAQNEEVVQHLLDREPSAALESLIQHKASSQDSTSLGHIAALAGQLQEDSEQAAKRPRRDPHSAAQRLCELVCSLERAPLMESITLPGTVRLGAQVGVSGHFIARIRKLALP